MPRGTDCLHSSATASASARSSRPLLIPAGKFTRPAGLIDAFDMLVAVLLARRDSIAKLNQGGGWDIEIEMLFLLGGLAIRFLGSGRYALSRGRGKWDQGTNGLTRTTRTNRTTLTLQELVFLARVEESCPSTKTRPQGLAVRVVRFLRFVRVSSSFSQ